MTTGPRSACDGDDLARLVTGSCDVDDLDRMPNRRMTHRPKAMALWKTSIHEEVLQDATRALDERSPAL